MANRLAKETSPYLLQHQNNPVDWYPWGPEALEASRREGKPILLSIGYSSCHWCHVMERESFENPEIAGLMNQKFINIKVDREERPDLDQIYQNVAQAISQSGGWPLTVFLTPDLKPFFGGTYFPPDDRYGRPGFPRVLVAISDAFNGDVAGVQENADKLTRFIARMESIPAAHPTEPGKIEEELPDLVQFLLERMDWTSGGLGEAPKFPNAMIFSFLWRFGKMKNHVHALNAVRLTLTKMASGGIYDQIGGGFHRYSVDGSWSVPHFEKMLYDNALLLRLYSEVLVSGGLSAEEEELYLKVVHQTLGYLSREMTSPEGAFYTAQDADSEGEEGKYFVWDLDELSKILTAEELRVFSLQNGVTKKGNFEHGKSILFLDRNLAEVSKESSLPESKVKELLESARTKLLDTRSQRVAPGLDNKILTSWNGLMISGLAWAAQALRAKGQKSQGDAALQSATRAFQFIQTQMKNSAGRLQCTFQKGAAKGNGYLDDYAFMAMGTLDLSRALGDSDEKPGISRKDLINQAGAWTQLVLKHFKDPSGPGYYFTSDDHETLIQRPKTVFDQAIPAGTAVILTCLCALADLTENDEDRKRFTGELEFQLGPLFELIKSNPYGFGEMLCLSLLKSSGPVTVQGKGAEKLCDHPHVFQKPGASVDGILICHRQVCGVPEKNLAQALEKVKAFLK